MERLEQMNPFEKLSPEEKYTEFQKMLSFFPQWATDHYIRGEENYHRDLLGLPIREDEDEESAISRRDSSETKVLLLTRMNLLLATAPITPFYKKSLGEKLDSHFVSGLEPNRDIMSDIVDFNSDKSPYWIFDRESAYEIETKGLAHKKLLLKILINYVKNHSEVEGTSIGRWTMECETWEKQIADIYEH